MAEYKNVGERVDSLVDATGAPLAAKPMAEAQQTAERTAEQMRHQANDAMDTWTKLVDRIMQPIAGAVPNGPMRNLVEGFSGIQSEVARFMTEEMRLGMETAQTLARSGSPQAFVQTQTEYLQGLAQRSMSEMSKLAELNMDAMRNVGSAAEKQAPKF